MGGDEPTRDQEHRHAPPSNCCELGGSSDADASAAFPPVPTGVQRTARQSIRGTAAVGNFRGATVCEAGADESENLRRTFVLQVESRLLRGRARLQRFDGRT